MADSHKRRRYPSSWYAWRDRRQAHADIITPCSKCAPAGCVSACSEATKAHTEGYCVRPLSKDPGNCCSCGSKAIDDSLQHGDWPGVHKCGEPYDNFNALDSQPRTSINDCDSPAKLSRVLSMMQPFILVLTANVIGGSEDFLKHVMPPLSRTVLLKPIPEPSLQPSINTARSVADSVGLTMLAGNHSSITNSADVLTALRQHNRLWDKVFINHPLGYPPAFLTELFSLNKRYISVTHDFYWFGPGLHRTPTACALPQPASASTSLVRGRRLASRHDRYLEKPQVTFKTLRTFEGVGRNAALRPFLRKLEMKTQTAANVAVFGMIPPTPRSLTVIPLPDYGYQQRTLVHSADDRTGEPNTLLSFFRHDRRQSAGPTSRAIKARPRLLIGCIGGIGPTKGSTLLVELAKYARVFVFGAIDNAARAAFAANQTWSRQATDLPLREEAYATPSALNQLLERERPNVLVFPALWPETYSFTLTLAMQTRLPLIVRRQDSADFDLAVAHRLKGYPYFHYHPFDDARRVVELARRLQATELYPVGTELHVQPQWAQLMHPMLWNVVLVGSKIFTSAAPLNYYASRSRFSPKERYEHTLETLASIRQKVPNSFIVLIDNSNLHKDARGKTWEDTLHAKSNLFINDWDNATLRHWTDDVEAKALGEALLLQQGLEALDRAEIMYRYVFKLTGRYVLNSRFSWHDFDNEHSIFKKAAEGDAVVSKSNRKHDYTYTSFYKIHERHLPWFRAFLVRTISDLQQMIEKSVPAWLWGDVEMRLAQFMEEHTNGVHHGAVRYTDILGVTQRVGPFEVEDVHI